MALKLDGHLFTGPFPIETTQVRANQAPVVFAVIAKEGEAFAPSFRVIDIGFSEDQGLRFADHPRRGAWAEAAGGEAKLGIYLFYAPKSEYGLVDRQRLAAELTQKYDPPRGLVEG
jgi:hypothetical protein